MTQEEKAKAYDEAIQKLRGMMPNWERLSYNGKTFLQDLIHIFPELKESEDEKIRKEILDYIDKATGCKRWIAWLEKQGENSPILSSSSNIGKMADIIREALANVTSQNILGKYELTFDDVSDWLDGQPADKKELKEIEKNAAWRAEDDERIQHITIALEGQNHHDGATGKYIIPYKEEISWLKSIKDRVQPQPKQEWSEDDALQLNEAIEAVNESSYSSKRKDVVIDWLKSLKERVQPQQKREWNEEDEERLSDAIFFVREYQIPTRDKRLLNAAKETEDWLKSLKDRVQPKQELSEEDVVHLTNAIIAAKEQWGTENRTVKWLKSLEDRYTWKPSDEQMKLLKEACDQHWEPDGLDPLYTLYQDLKKLREE